MGPFERKREEGSHIPLKKKDRTKRRNGGGGKKRRALFGSRGREEKKGVCFCPPVSRNSKGVNWERKGGRVRLTRLLKEEECRLERGKTERRRVGGGGGPVNAIPKGGKRRKENGRFVLPRPNDG